MLIGAATAARADAGAPPFSAWVDAEALFVKEHPRRSALDVALLRRGDVVTVARCEPDCSTPGAWALLSPLGAVPLAYLRVQPIDEQSRAVSAMARYRYGRVRGGGVAVRALPSASAGWRGYFKAGSDLAFLPAAAGDPVGWLRRPTGGYVNATRIRLFEPSLFAGRKDPPPVLAILLRDARLQPSVASGHAAAATALLRQSSVPALRPRGDRVEVPGGTVARRDVRLAFTRPRPAPVPAGARWVHVDVTEQVLTAYEGDRLVYATLVSTGRHGPKTATPLGLFTVWHKVIHSAMHGEPDDPYLADEVPFVQFFKKGRALHGTFWHDGFGRRHSHGCVNLSFADAEWLFRWAPPELPPGWHSIAPPAARRGMLWVQIQAAGPRWPSPPAEAATAGPGL
jgi:lipoprotein-anchoring transpeptidase ErfK/SrfK